MNVASKNKVLHYFSRGKLLLSGEYLVLKGARALALPLKFGQRIEIEEAANEAFIDWKSFMYEDIWFTAKFNRNLDIAETNKTEIAKRLQNILKISRQLNPAFLDTRHSFTVQSYSNFNFGWGIGSSSTLISNVAYWANVDAYKLNEKVFGGSGFDIACSRNEKPFIYSWQNDHRKIEHKSFNPPFQSELIFIYLGKKQNTQRSIKSFYKSATFKDNDIQRISNISEMLAKTDVKEDFMELLLEHEQIIARVLNMKRIQDEHFPDFDGVLKSLGSWGGDFMMAVSNRSNDYVFEYFSQKGLDTIFTYDEIVL